MLDKQIIEVCVMQEDIDNGKAGSWDSCPLTLALLRTKKQLNLKETMVAITNSEILEFVRTFDEQGKNGVIPSKFFISIENANGQYIYPASR